MKFSKNVNSLRRVLMRFFTKNIGASKTGSKKLATDSLDIKKILICRPNARLGNLLLITPLIQEVTLTFPSAQIDLFVKGSLMPVILKNYPQIREIIELPKKPFKSILSYIRVWVTIKKQKYDLVLNVDQESSSGRLAVKISNADFKFYGNSSVVNEVNEKGYVHIAKYPVYNFRNFLKTNSFNSGSGSVAPVDLKLTVEEIASGKKILWNSFKNEKKTISIFTYATGDKCYSQLWWADFYTLLKQKYERDFNIIEILPVENVSQIQFQAINFYSKDIREIGSVIANSSVFIGADSGIMHLATSVNTPTVGLFSVSNLKKYEPYNYNSIAINTQEVTNKKAYIVEIDHILGRKFL